MRDIEFRAWHKIECKMCKVTTLVPGSGAFLVGVTTLEDQIAGKFIVKAAKEGRFCNDFEYELEQFTGLLDKNGKKIFEGDRLLVEYNYLGLNEVKFMNGKYNISVYDLSKCSVKGSIHDNIK